jgi:hypothetical protein
VWAAKDKGLLKKYGLDVEIIAMQGGTQLVQAMIGNSIDFSVMGGAYLTGAMKGADLVMVATHMDKFPYSLIVKPSIKRSEDLKRNKTRDQPFRLQQRCRAASFTAALRDQSRQRCDDSPGRRPDGTLRCPESWCG